MFKKFQKQRYVNHFVLFLRKTNKQRKNRIFLQNEIFLDLSGFIFISIYLDKKYSDCLHHKECEEF